MADWTLVASTLGAALIAGLAGLDGVLLQSQIARAQSQGETERLRLQHREDERRHRQGVYHDFMDAVSSIDTILRAAAPRILDGTIMEESWKPVRELLIERLYRFRHCVNGLVLFGSEEVERAARDLDVISFAGADGELLTGLLRGEVEIGDGESSLTAVQIMLDPWTSTNEARQGWDESVARVTAAMRADVRTEPGGRAKASEQSGGGARRS